MAPYFGDGLANSEFYQMEMTPEDRESVGFSSISYQNGHLNVKCSKSGAATITVTMLIGGGSLDNNKNPYPTKVTKSFVIISKATPSANGGWL